MNKALKAVQMIYANSTKHDWPKDIWDAVEEALAQPEQEAVAWLWELTGEVTTDPDRADGMWKPLFTTPPQRTWVGLTDEEVEQLAGLVDWNSEHATWNFSMEVEAKLKEKNT